MLTEVQKKLESAFPRRKHMFPVTTTLEIRQELKAATVSILSLSFARRENRFSGHPARVPLLERARREEQVERIFCASSIV